MMMKRIYLSVVLTTLCFGHLALASENHSDHQEHDEKVTIHLTPSQIAMANITVKSVRAQTHKRKIYAPGELKANDFTSYLVAPRNDAVVVRRHTALGENVSVGTPLVTLYSESMAQAQADYLIATSEWQRAQAMRAETLSEEAKTHARARFSAAYSTLRALGVSKTEITAITSKAANELGEYTLVAERSGIVTMDDFSQGQHIKAGQTLLAITDESTLWVEAQLPPDSQLALDADTEALVKSNQGHYQAKVLQAAHTIDPVTRTRRVRLIVDNPEDQLHAGMFVAVQFLLPSEKPIIALPQSALMQGHNGTWQVYVENKPGEFMAKAVELGQTYGELVAVSGLKDGEKVATSGAFFVASEQAKSGFDPHNH